MYTNKKCTLYLESNNYKPIVLEKCFVTHRSIFTSNKQGLSYTEKAFCICSDLNHGTIFNGGKDFLLEGVNIQIETSNDSEQSRSMTKRRLKDAGAYTVMLADLKGFGSKNMQHWELSCQ